MNKISIQIMFCGCLICMALLSTSCFKGEGLEPFVPPSGLRIEATVPSLLYSNKKDIYFDASRTSTLNGPRELFFLWTCTKFPGGSQPKIDNPQAPVIKFDSLPIGIYTFRLKVNDVRGNEIFSDFNLEIKKDTLTQGPKMIPLPDQVFYLPKTSFTLYAISAFTVNPAGRDLSFLWTLLQQPSGSMPLTMRDKTKAAFIVEGFEEGSYQFGVEVTNELGLSVSDTMMVTIMKDTLQGKSKIYEELTWAEITAWSDVDVYDHYNVLDIYEPEIFYGRTESTLEVSVWNESTLDWSPKSDYTWTVKDNTVHVVRKNYTDLVTGKKAKIMVKFL